MARILIGDWCFHTNAGELRGATLCRRLEPRVGDVLHVLVDNAGEVVSRTHLLGTVWRDRIVVDEVLTRAICQIRAALNDVTSPHRYVETLPKRGYRLIAAVRFADAPVDRQIPPDNACPAALLRRPPDKPSLTPRRAHGSDRAA